MMKTDHAHFKSASDNNGTRVLIINSACPHKSNTKRGYGFFLFWTKFIPDAFLAKYTYAAPAFLVLSLCQHRPITLRKYTHSGIFNNRISTFFVSFFSVIEGRILWRKLVFRLCQYKGKEMWNFRRSENYSKIRKRVEYITKLPSGIIERLPFILLFASLCGRLWKLVGWNQLDQRST